MNCIALDIETIPGIDLELARQLAADSGVEDLSDQGVRTFAATSPALARIAVVGMATRGTPLGNRDVVISLSDEIAEGTVVEKVLAALDYYLRRGAQLVTFNGRRFDAPLLVSAALRHGVHIPPTTLDVLREYRYAKPARHVDVRELLTNYGACGGSLRAWCIGLGIPDPKADCDGSQVAELIGAGKIEQVAAYCLNDCERTLDLLERFMACTSPKNGDAV